MSLVSRASFCSHDVDVLGAECGHEDEGSARRTAAVRQVTGIIKERGPSHEEVLREPALREFGIQRGVCLGQESRRPETNALCGLRGSVRLGGATWTDGLYDRM